MGSFPKAYQVAGCSQADWAMIISWAPKWDSLLGSQACLRGACWDAW